MHRIDGPGAAPGNLFTEGNPPTTEATTVTDDWLNAVQEEVLYVLGQAGILPNKVDNTQLYTAMVALGIGSGVGPTNLVVNGDFRFTQGIEGASSSGTVDSTVFDGFVNTPGGSGTITVSKIASPGGDPEGASEDSKFFMQHQQNVGATTTEPAIVTGHDDVQMFAGEEITLAVDLRLTAGGPTQNVIPRITQHFGTGGSPSADVTLSGTAFEVTTVWDTFVFTTTLGSLLTKTVGTNGDHLSFQLDLPLSTTFTLQVSDFRVVKGPAPLAYPRLGDAEELRRVQRYREASYGYPDLFANADIPPVTDPGYHNLVHDVGWFVSPNVGNYFPVGIHWSPKSIKAQDRNSIWERPKFYTYAASGGQDKIWWANVTVTLDPPNIEADSSGIGQIYHTTPGTPPSSGTPGRICFRWLADATPDWVVA